MAILTLAIFCFAMAFYLQGNNQMDLLFEAQSTSHMDYWKAYKAFNDTIANPPSATSGTRLLGATSTTPSSDAHDINVAKLNNTRNAKYTTW
jgi:hypothetical protein